MLTLPHQFEYLSDAWLDEARAYLARETAQKKERLGGRPFSLAERFTDAPPHLKFPDNVAAWSMRYDGETVTVSRDFDAGADQVVEGDYQAALTGAQFVGLLAPGALRMMVRELATIYGKDRVPRVRGKIENPAANKILMLLHDHMGRRTVENPDLAHRAARQGLSANIREMEETGYTVIRNAISPEFAGEVRNATLRALMEHDVISLQWMLYHGREIELLALNPQMMTLIDASLGRGAVIASLSAIRKGPGPGFIPIHTDYAHVPEPYPEFPLTGVGVWALEDWTVASGPTWIVPGSHRMRRAPRPGEGHNGGVPIEMPKGSAVYFTHGVWHWQGDRSEAGERVTLHMHFNRGILRSLEPKKVDPQMLHRNPPRLGEMLGEDDWFDKMAGIGRDHVRFAHMM
ncbi:MAG TPA: phytanoyl-CoA dioxygenase family protein, partial [Rhizomicrobium sp.]|nr:phytanoyl-CoA dioxygenase family protein [Rhizomicrobium sp.]